MFISIVIPCLNEAEGIAATLETLRPLRSRGAEVIVADGGSSDDTVERARAADRVLVAPRGRALQMNAGAACARGEVLLFLHADCRLPERADASILHGMQRSGRSWGRFDVRVEKRAPLLQLVAASMNWRSRLTGIATGDQAIFVTRALFETAGRYAAIALMEDIELSRRLKRHGPPLCLADPVRISTRRWETHGILRTVLLMWRLRLAYWLGADPQQLALHYAPHRD